MNFLSHTRIGTRLAAAIAIVLLLAVIATTVGPVHRTPPRPRFPVVSRARRLP